MDPKECVPNFLYKNRNLPIPCACCSSEMFETTKLFAIPEHAAVAQPDANTIQDKAGRDAETGTEKELGTDIECSDSEYEEGDSDFEYAAQYCA